MKHTFTKKTIKSFAPWLLLIALLAVFRLFPGFSGLWMDHIARPVSRLLHEVTALIPFPILETSSIGLAGLLGCFCMRWLFRPMRLLRIIGRTAWIIALVYILLWFPAYWHGEPSAYAPPESSRLIWLCEQLIDRLNASELRFPDGAEILAEAGKQTIPSAELKFARYPEWMNGLQIAGLYSPWTGEIILNPQTPAAALPFTAMHELAHLRGIADEGAANIAAWEICISSGGYFADSARLWALKYAFQQLLALEPAAVSPLYARMNSLLRPVFYAIGGATQPSESPLLRWLGLSNPMGDYDNLIPHLLGT